MRSRLKTLHATKNLVFWIAFLLAALYLFLTLRHGISLSPDVVSYIGGARGLFEGHGYTIPAMGGGVQAITHHPPLMSILYALLAHLLGDDFFQVAKVTNILLFALTAGLIAKNTFQLTDSMPTSLTAAFTFMVSYNVISVSVRAWSEPAFILLTILILSLFVRYVSSHSPRHLYFASLLISVSIMSRFLGVSLIACGLLVILYAEVINKNAPFSVKSAAFLKRSFLFGILSISSFILWVIRSRVQGVNASSRTLGLYAIEPENIRQILLVTSNWLLPSGIPLWIGSVCVLAVMALIFFCLKKENPLLRGLNHSHLQIAAYLAFVFSYFSTIFLSKIFANEVFTTFTPENSRYLTPPYVILLIVCHSLFFRSRLQLRRNRLAFSMAAVLFLAFYAINFHRGLKHVYHSFRTGHSAGTVNDSLNTAFFKAIRSIDTSTTLYVLGNWESHLLVHGFRYAESLPNLSQEKLKMDRTPLPPGGALKKAAILVSDRFTSPLELVKRHPILTKIDLTSATYSAYEDGIIIYLP